MTRRVALLIPAALAGAALVAFDGFPRILSVDPDSGKVGDMVVAKGESLDKSAIGELFLTDGKIDTKVEIADQSEKEIKFKVPAAAKAGRYRLMIVTPKKDSAIEQPVMFTVE